MNKFRRATFNSSDLIKLPKSTHPVVLKSGGPIMELETIEGNNGLVSYDVDGKRQRILLPLICLYHCVEQNNVDII